jgi:phosphoglycolate phosphatase
MTDYHTTEKHTTETSQKPQTGASQAPHTANATAANALGRIKKWLQSLSFRTGVIVLLCCIPFYILSFAQMLLPISAAAKGVLWTVLFGLAKTCQYGGLTILGVEGFNRLKALLRKKPQK